MRVAGYLRLSRDEDRESYSSILAQKSMIEECARENNWHVEKYFEDDNWSGYTFDRPGFNAMLKALENDEIDVIIAKDLSRIGRHNAYTLLFLDRVKQMGKRLMLPKEGEGYDTARDENDLLGIKTWYNEMYVKDISRKIKSSIKAKQREGRMIVKESFGYRRSFNDKHRLEIDLEAAETVRLIYRLCLSGLGYRKIAEYLNREGFPTPSMHLKRRHQLQNMQFLGIVSEAWNVSAVQRILKDDIYIGILRLGKTEKPAIKGKAICKPREEQYVFEGHHTPIVTKEEYDQVQDLIGRRVKTGSKGAASKVHLFSGLLYCEDCGSYMIAYSKKGKTKSYICGTYHKLGKKGCERHTIRESTLQITVLEYLKAIIRTLEEDLKGMKIHRNQKSEDGRQLLLDQLRKERLSLRENHKLLIIQKIAELSAAKDLQYRDFVMQSFEELQSDMQGRMYYLDKRIEELEKMKEQDAESDSSNAFQLLHRMVDKQKLEKKDVEIIIERIIMDKEGNATFFFQGDFASICNFIREDANLAPDP